jgi:hypothetical protein
MVFVKTLKRNPQGRLVKVVECAVEAERRHVNLHLELGTGETRGTGAV